MRSAKQLIRWGLIGLLGAQSLSAELVSDYVIGVNAVTQTDPPRVTLQWPALNSPSGSITVQRRVLGQTSWTTQATIANTATSYMDSGVDAGVLYEYLVTGTAAGAGATGALAVTIERPIVDDRGKVLLLVDSSRATALADELARLEDDLAGEGWTVVRRDVARSTGTGPNTAVMSATAVAAVKSIIAGEYEGTLKAVLILGHVPVPYSGFFSPDGHSSAPRPADIYYAMPLVSWTDTTQNSPNAQSLDRQNIPGDGKFDPSIYQTGEVKFPVGRVDFWGLNALQPTTETELLRRYLDKNHAFRNARVRPANRVLIDDNFGTFYSEAFAQNGYRIMSLVGSANAVKGDMLTDSVPSLFNYGCGGGSGDAMSGIGGAADCASPLRSGQGAVFNQVFGSGLLNYDDYNNFMRALLAGPGLELSSVWSGRPNYSFHTMAIGETLGQAFLTSVTRPSDHGNSGFSPVAVHRSLQGDPTLRQHIVAPPPEVFRSAPGTLAWSASEDAPLPGFLGYHVYRSDSSAGRFTRMTASPVSGPAWTDPTPPPGAFYRVRAVKRETTTGGTFINSSKGVLALEFVPLQITSQPQPASAWEGNPATFDTASSGVPSPNYQWQRNGADIPGATSPTLTLSGLTPADHGAVFRCRISTSQQTIFSDPAALTVLHPPAGVVTRIRFHPREGNAALVRGGVFEGANEMDGPYSTLHVIPQSHDETGWTLVPLSTGQPAPFRFLRYRATASNSRGNIAEVEFLRLNTLLTGLPFGSPGSSPATGPAAVQDARVDTFFDSTTATGAFAGIDTATPVNRPPMVDAGGDRGVLFPAALSLTGSATNADELPTGWDLSYMWSSITGPGTVAIATPNQASTSVTFGAPGEYVLRLTVSDGDLDGYDEVSVSVTAPPVLRYSFDQTSGATLADSAPPPVIATLTNFPANPWKAGRFGNALEFDGANDVVTTPDDPLLESTDQLTLSFWVFPTNYSNNARGLVSKRVSTDQGNAYGIFLFTENRVFVDLDGIGDRFGSTASLPALEWSHVALVFDGSLPANQRARLYINGVPDTTAAEQSASIPDTSAGLQLGQLQGGSHFFAGKLDEMRIYRAALTAGAIAALHTPNQGQPDPAISVSRNGQYPSNGGTDGVTRTNAGSSTALSYHIANHGGAFLTIVPAVVTQPENCTVIVNAQPASPIAAGAAGALGISVTPVAAGAWSFKIQISNNDPVAGSYCWTVSGLAEAPQSGAPVYTDDFSGPGALHGAAPDTRPGSETWTTAADTTMGSPATGHATLINATRAAYLPFTPLAGRIYTLSADVRVNSTGGGLATIGFYDNRITPTTAPNAGSPNDVRTPWLGLRNNGAALLRDLTTDGQGFADKTTNTGTSTIKLSDSPLAFKWNTLRLVLDTTTANWKVAAYVTNASDEFVQVGTTHSYSGNGGLLTGVTRVGFSSINGAVIDYDNFKLTDSAGVVATAAELEIRRDTTTIGNGGSDSVAPTMESTATQLTYTLANTGTATLQITGNPVITGSTNCSAVVTAPPAPSIAVDDSTPLEISVTPTAPGAWSFTVSVPNNDPRRSSYTFAVAGTATVLDSDGDGYSDELELALGSGHTDPASVPAFRGSFRDDGTLRFPSAIGRTYRIETSVDLTPGGWTVREADIPGTGGMITLVVPVSGGRRFYRIVSQ